MSKRRKALSILVLAGCMATIALVSVFAGYGIATKIKVGDGTVIFQNGGLETVDSDNVSPEVAESVASTPSIRIIEPQSDASDTIAIPGFKKLAAKGKTLEAEAITNPIQNTCYFIVTLILPGGAEIYRSSYIEPGQSLGDVELLVPLVAKNYEGAIARYSCYAIGDLKPLNGADVKFTLEVAQ